jgi:hypothetical protein
MRTNRPLFIQQTETYGDGSQFKLFSLLYPPNEQIDVLRECVYLKPSFRRNVNRRGMELPEQANSYQQE